MNWSELVEAVAERTGRSRADVRQVLDAFEEATLEALGGGDDVSLKGLGRVVVREQAPRAIRRIDDQRKFYLGRRHRARLRPAAPLKRALEGLASADWRSPSHQAAWRKAETLLSDLALYHGSRAPSLDSTLPHPEVRQQLAAAFGTVWDRVCRTYDTEVPAAVRGTSDYLAEAALRRWSR